MKMAVHYYCLVMLLQILFLFWPIKAFGQSLCPTQCGNLSFSYPFGIGEECYYDKSFEVVCDNYSSSYPKAFLPSINYLELLQVYPYSSTIRVSIPVISSTPTSNIVKGVNLAGSHFTFSADINKFVALGCENPIDYNGCFSISNCDPTQKLGCYDFLCYISPNITQVFDVNSTYFDSQSTRQKCQSIFVVDDDWIADNWIDPRNLTNHRRGFRNQVREVPAVLEWGENKGECLEEYNSNSQFCNGDICLISVSSGYKCLCNRSSDLPGRYCSGTLICASGNNCSECPQGFSGVYLPSLLTFDTVDTTFCSQQLYPHISQKSRVKYIIMGCLSGGLALVFLLGGIWWSYKFVKRRRETKLKQMFFKRNGGMLLQQKLSSNESRIEKIKLFTSNDLVKATDNYSANRILGQGGQGTVYKGMLTDGRTVAVKKSKVLDESNVEQFINEVVILSQINHRNIVKILGCCLETDVPLLVYEFIPNGTLYQYIHGQIEEFPVTWETLLRVAVEVSSALYYLHSSASIPIYHRDIKSTNILLDDKYRAKVSDFGTSRYITVDQTHLTTRVHGTFGYLDPEYFRSSQYTEKSDVYSFGVVLVEILTGEKPIRLTDGEEDKSLVRYFLQAMKENRLLEVIDARVLKEAKNEEIITVAMLAKRCLNLNGKKRPTMKEVAFELGGIRASIGASILQQNREELDFQDGDNTGNYFETDSSSAGTSSLKAAAFSIDVVPLLSQKW